MKNEHYRKLGNVMHSAPIVKLVSARAEISHGQTEITSPVNLDLFHAAGAYHGKMSFDTFSHSKGVLTRSNLIDMPLRYPPYGNNVKLLKWLFRVIG